MARNLFVSRGMSVNVVSDKRMSATEAAYVAGFIDGEGTVSICRERRVENRSGYRYKPLMRVSNSHRGALERIRDICGNGRIIGNYHKRPEHHKEVFTLSWTANQIRHLLPQIQGYLLVKSEQAATLAEFLKSIPSGPNITPDQALQQEALRRHMRALNQRGIDRAPLGDITLRDPKPNRWEQARAKVQ